jgi:Rod binding domain-containing protein
MVAPLAMLGLSLAAKVVNGIGGSASSAGASPEAARTRKTADDFETMFLEQGLDRLTQSVGEDGPLGDNGEGGAIYKSMLSKEYAKSITQSGGVGIADQVYRQMLQMQEGAGRGGA